MSRDLAIVFVASMLATFNPSLLAAVTVMLLLPNPKRLMLGYLLGAYSTSIGAGLARRVLARGVGRRDDLRSRRQPRRDSRSGPRR